MKRYWAFFLIILGSWADSWAQKIEPKAYFLQDTLKVGKPVEFSLSLAHNPNLEILFPDSSFSYVPFEYVSRKFFPTRTQNGISVDSVIYTLRSFEMDTLQMLALPVYIIAANGDTTRIFSNTDEIKTVFTLKKMPDSIQFISNTKFYPITTKFNYPYLLGGFVLLVVISGGVILIFGKRITQAYQLNRLKKQYQKFIIDYEQSSQRPLKEEVLNHSLGIWKSYLEKLKNIPFSSYTTKEILEATQSINSESQNIELANALKQLDKAIYGGVIDENTKISLLVLKKYASELYDSVTKEINLHNNN